MPTQHTLSHFFVKGRLIWAGLKELKGSWADNLDYMDTVESRLRVWMSYLAHSAALSV